MRKTCSRCRRSLPHSRFGACSAAKDNLQFYCKACLSEYKTSRKRRLQGIADGHGRKIKKTCKRCDKNLFMDLFPLQRGSEDGYFSECLACINRAEREKRYEAPRPRY